MRSFRHVIPPMRLYQGNDSLEHLGHELARLSSRRAVIVCGASVSQSPLLDLVRSALGERYAGVFAGVRAHSPLPAVEEASRRLRRLEADAVVSIGGGSAIVTARAASILLAEGTDIRSLCTQSAADGRLKSPKLQAPKIPQLIVPSTPTTAIVKAGSAVLDPEEGSRLALYDPKTRAQAVFLHPQVIESAPHPLFVSAAVNTLTLAIEGLLSRSGNAISDALLMHSIRLLTERLPTVSNDVSVRGELMLASILCGQGSDYTGAGLAIPLGHALGARFHVDNGITDAIVLPHVLRFNAPAAQRGVEKLADALQVSGRDSAVNVDSIVTALETVFSSLHLPRRLRDIGVTRESLPELADVTMKDWFVQSNPRHIDDQVDIQHVLEEAW